MTDQNSISINKRSGKDRRTKSGFNIRSIISGGSRGKIRRLEDKGRIFYVDHFGTGLFIVIVSILFLSVIDILLTLYLFETGAYENDSVMTYFVDFGPYSFFISKYLLTIILIIVLLMFRNIVIRKIKISGRLVLYLMAVIYLAIVINELYMVFNVPFSSDYNLPPHVFSDTITLC